jgi:hypothetical protein
MPVEEPSVFDSFTDMSEKDMYERYATYGQVEYDTQSLIIKVLDPVEYLGFADFENGVVQVARTLARKWWNSWIDTIENGL